MSEHVKFNYLRQQPEKGDVVGHSSFLVTVSDLALFHLHKDHPIRHLVHRWNGCAPASMRVQALAEALREFEARQIVKDQESGAFARFVGRCIRGGVITAFFAGFTVGGIVVAFALFLLQ